jgi:hypothetical protein
MKVLLRKSFVGLAVCVVVGCSERAAKTPSTAEAAAQIDQAFAGAENSVKQSVSAISEAMRAGELDRAVVSLTAVQSQPIATPEQFQAVRNSSIALETELLKRVQAGDEKAKATYQLLKELRRN